MATPATADRRHRLLALTAVVGAAAYAGWMSGTVPFSVAAYSAVAVPSAVFLIGVVVTKVAPGRVAWALRRPPEIGRGGGGSAVWIGLIAVVVGVELASYFHGGPRADYPTLSSIAASAFRHRPVKATAVFAWLVGGWRLMTR